MSTLTLPPPTLTLPSAPCHPGLTAIMRRVAGSVAVACVVPAALFYAALQTAGLDEAIVVAMVWGYGALAWRHLTGRAVSGLLVLTVSVLTLRSVFALATGDSYVYFLQPLVTDGLLGVVFLGSAMLGRPLVSKLAADFYPVDDEFAARPAVRRLFVRLTLLWAGVCLVRSVGGFWLLQTLSVEDFVLIKESSFVALTLGAVAVTIATGVATLRRERLVG